MLHHLGFGLGGCPPPSHSVFQFKLAPLLSTSNIVIHSGSPFRASCAKYLVLLWWSSEDLVPWQHHCSFQQLGRPADLPKASSHPLGCVE